VTNGSTGERDFFVSFNSADRAWATWIAWTLEENGYSVIFQDWDFRGNFVLEMDRAHRETRRTVAVLSPDYLTSRFAQPEWAARFAQDATSEHDLLIPVRVRSCKLEGLLAQVVYVDFVGCDEVMAKKRLLNRVSGIRTKPEEPPLWPPGAANHKVVIERPVFPCPYPGLAPFRTDQAPFFFGRKRETEELINRLRRSDCLFLAVVGASGTGKSSLIYAGLVPRLHAGDAIDGSDTWCVKSFKPGSLGENPFLALATYGLEPLLPQYNGRANDLAGELARSPASITGFVDQALAGASPSGELVWFVDQFEELFTQAKEEYRSGFVDLLAEAVCHPRVRVLTTLREEFQSHALKYSKLAALLQTETGSFLLGPPGKGALREMIRCPAEVAGVAVEDDLIEAIIRDAGDDLGPLSLVAFTLERLWRLIDRKASDRRMTLGIYTLIKQLQGVIANYTDQLLEDLRQREGVGLDQKLRVIFAALVTVDDAGQAIRKRTLRSPALDGVGQVVNKLIGGGLLCVQRGKDNRETVEIIQDELLDKWPALKSWIDENLRDIVSWRLLAAAAGRWRNASWRYRNAYLWRGHRLKEAKQLVKRWRYDPAKIETENIIRFTRASTVRK
jgi:hypothetical protein